MLDGVGAPMRSFSHLGTLWPAGCYPCPPCRLRSQLKYLVEKIPTLLTRWLFDAYPRDQIGCYVFPWSRPLWHSSSGWESMWSFSLFLSLQFHLSQWFQTLDFPRLCRKKRCTGYQRSQSWLQWAVIHKEKSETKTHSNGKESSHQQGPEGEDKGSRGEQGGLKVRCLSRMQEAEGSPGNLPKPCWPYDQSSSLQDSHTCSPHFYCTIRLSFSVPQFCLNRVPETSSPL